MLKGIKKRIAWWLIKDLIREGIPELKVGNNTLKIYPNAIKFETLTSDPTLEAGKLWYRSDLGRLRFSPDGTNVAEIASVSGIIADGKIVLVSGGKLIFAPLYAYQLGTNVLYADDDVVSGSVVSKSFRVDDIYPYPTTIRIYCERCVYTDTCGTYTRFYKNDQLVYSYYKILGTTWDPLTYDMADVKPGDVIRVEFESAPACRPSYLRYVRVLGAVVQSLPSWTPKFIKI